MATGNTNSLHLLLEQEVIANPTLDGTEDDLTGLQVDGTKYKVPSGGGSGDKLYQHNVFIKFYNGDVTHYAYIVICNNSPSQLNENDIKNYLATDNVTSTESFKMAIGSYNYSGTRSTISSIGYKENKYYCSIVEYGTTSIWQIPTSSYTQTITDVVTQIANAVNVAPSVELYNHLITVTEPTYGHRGVFSIINNSSTPITSLSNIDGTYQATGGTGNTQKFFMYVTISNNNCTWYYKDGTSNLGINFTGTISDTVTQIL